MQHAWWVALGLIACNGDKDTDSDKDADADTDADTDSDTDADTDTDTEPAVDEDGDGFAADVDCDDADDTVFPGAPDLCGDERVTNCDRESDAGLVTLDDTQGFDDLGAALTAAAADSEILICEGTLVGPFVATVPVRLVAFGDPAATILDGDGDGSTLAVRAGTEIVGLTITRGVSSFGPGGGITLTTPGTLLVEDSVVRGNRAELGGGIGAAEGGLVTLVNTVIEDNFGSEGGGGAWMGPGSVLDLTEGSTITGNSATLYGAGVALDGAALIGGVVSGNSTTDYTEIEYEEDGLLIDDPYGGAGVSATGISTVTGTEISGNVANDGGGGVSATTVTGAARGVLTLTDVEIRDNRSQTGGGFSAIDADIHFEGTTEVHDNAGYNAGGGITLLSTITGGVVRNNEAQEWGGGVVPFSSTVEGMVISDNLGGLGGGIFQIGSLTLRGVTVTGNQATVGGGIGSNAFYYGYASSDAVLEDCVISGNEAADGGGMFAAFETTLTNTVFSGNSAQIGGAIWADRNVLVTINGGEVVGNSASERGGGVHVAFRGGLAVNDADFGQEATDNVPGDVFTGDAELVGYGAGATFTCDDEACDPLP